MPFAYPGAEIDITRVTGPLGGSDVELGTLPVRLDGGTDDGGTTMADEQVDAGADGRVDGALDAAEGPVEDRRIVAFWDAARGHVGFGKLDPVTGETPEGVLPPPSWSYGDDDEAAELLARVLDGRKTATALAVAELEQVGLELPRVGDLSIVVDGAGNPRALLRTVEVEILPFDQVTAEQAAAEAEDDGSLESWRSHHEASWRRVLGDAFSPTIDVMMERFELVYPTGGATPAVD